MDSQRPVENEFRPASDAVLSSFASGANFDPRDDSEDHPADTDWQITQLAEHAFRVVGNFDAYVAAPNNPAARLQRKYLREAEKLDAAIANPASAHRRVNAFARMIERVKLIPNPQMKAEIINAYVNFLAWAPEHSEIPRILKYPSMLEDLIAHKTICDGSARLKMYALLSLGFKPEDVCWLSEATYNKHGEQVGGGHVVILLRVGDVVIVLNHNEQQYPHGNITPEDAKKMALYLSLTENDVAHTNLTQGSFMGRNNFRYVATHGFTIHQAFNYNSFVIDETFRPSPSEWAAPIVKSGLTLNELDKYRIMAILAPALKVNFKIGKPPNRPFASKIPMGPAAAYLAPATQAQPVYV